MADKATTEMERIYTIPLRKVKASPRNHMADRSVKAVKNYLMKHMKSSDIWIDASVNEELWKHGMYTSPSRIRVRARKFDDGVVEVSLPDIEAADSIRAQIKARQEKAEGEAKKDAGEKVEEKAEGDAASAEKPPAPKDEAEKPAAKEPAPKAAKPKAEPKGGEAKAAAKPAAKKE